MIGVFTPQSYKIFSNSTQFISKKITNWLKKYFKPVTNIRISRIFSPGNPSERLAEEEIPAFREAVNKMSGYIVMEDSAFHLTVSKEKAVEYGIPEKYYLRIQQELDYTNYTIKENNRKGIPVTFDEYWAE